MTESEFKKWVRKNWKGWLSSYEPRKGGTVGVADLQIVVKKRLVPIELKVGHIVDNLTREVPLLRLADVRGAQLEWHRGLIQEEVPAFFLVCNEFDEEPETIMLIPAEVVVRFYPSAIPFDEIHVVPAEAFAHYIKRKISPML